MLKSCTGYSTAIDNITLGIETAKNTLKELSNSKIGFLYTSEKNNIKELMKGIRSVTNMPIIGSTSSNAIITNEGIITAETGFAGMLALEDKNMTVGLACHEAGKDPRAIGRRIAIEAVEIAKTTRAPAYFYMVANHWDHKNGMLWLQAYHSYIFSMKYSLSKHLSHHIFHLYQQLAL